MIGGERRDVELERVGTAKKLVFKFANHIRLLIEDY